MPRFRADRATRGWSRARAASRSSRARRKSGTVAARSRCWKRAAPRALSALGQQQAVLRPDLLCSVQTRSALAAAAGTSPAASCDSRQLDHTVRRSRRARIRPRLGDRQGLRRQRAGALELACQTEHQTEIVQALDEVRVGVALLARLRIATARSARATVSGSLPRPRFQRRTTTASMAWATARESAPARRSAVFRARSATVEASARRLPASAGGSAHSRRPEQVTGGIETLAGEGRGAAVGR